MDLIDALKLRNTSVEILHNEGKHLRIQWEENFASKLSSKEKREIYLNQFLWHIFSYKKIEYLEKEDAEKAFNNVIKNECYVFYQNRDEALRLNNVENIKAEDFNSEQDIYVVNKKVTWTYVHTHEGDCGPYFCRFNNI